jgi:tol-pal system protein YbgF
MRGTTHSVRVALSFAALLLLPGQVLGKEATGSPTAVRTSLPQQIIVAQAQPQPQPQVRPPARTSTPPPAGRQPGKEEGPAQGRPAGEAQLRQRVEQLEEQLTEMQVVIGTLESLARSPGTAASTAPVSRGAPASGADQGRIEDLETQVRALTNQLEQLSEQVRQLGGRRTDSGSPGMVASREAPAFRPDSGPPARSDGRSWQSGPAPEAPRGGAEGNFGSVTVTPGPERDPIGRLITREPVAGSDRVASATTDAAQVGGNPKELYETAYGYLLQQDYNSAEASFEEFLRLHPTDRLAADAQYWLGESLYVQRRYKPAGQAFLKVIQNHQASAKVPNSLLKLAMTLEQLGQKDCALFSELETRHPNAAADVKNRARVVRQRVGC